MKEYNDRGVKFNYKEGLNENDYLVLIASYINAYNDGFEDIKDNIKGFHKNPIVAERMFNLTLGNLCIENFDDELHKNIFEKGVYSFLKDDIYNTKEAYDLAKEICKNIDTIGETIYGLVEKIKDLMPSEIDVNELKDAWDKVSQEYKKIVKDEE